MRTATDLFFCDKSANLKHPTVYVSSQLWFWTCQIVPPQYIGTAKQQVTFTAGVREMLRVAAQDIVDHQPAAQQS